jgi:hypothetical protein
MYILFIERTHMAQRIKIKQLKEDLGIETPDEWMSQLEEWVSDSICPALCEDGCEVEPDGHCEHGHPSVLIAMGII